MPNEWFLIGKKTDFPVHEVVYKEETPYGPVVVINDDFKFHVLSGICTHERFELGGSPFREGQITCTLHMSSFDVKSGEPTSPPAEEKLAVFSIKIEKERIYIRK